MARSEIVLFFLLTVFNVYGLKLQEVFILGRHHVRTSLHGVIQRVSSLEVPKYDPEKAALLTPRGVILEQYMGEYFSEWLSKEGLFTDVCPDNKSLLIYANIKQRTIETAKAFASSAFKNCNVSVKYETESDIDQVFNVVFRNTTSLFEELFKKQVQEKLDNLDLIDAYVELNKILDVKNSELCKTESFCDFRDKKDIILYRLGEEPDIYGPLSIGNFVVDVFLMSYYDGKPLEEIAWGKIKNQRQWKTLTKVTRENQNVRFNQSYLAEDIARPMLKYIENYFLRDSPRKFTMLVGHDSNINTVMAALGFKTYELDHFEKLPVGGKLVFQKWRDADGKDFLKIEYVYQSVDQLRNCTQLSLATPPASTILEMTNCRINANGLCPWEDFLNVLKAL